MKKVLLYFPGYNSTIGGSENRFLSFAAWLQNRSDLTVAMRIEPDFRFLASQYGIHIDGSKVKAIKLALHGWRRIIGRVFACEEELALKLLAKKYDICISCHGPRDFGKPAYHFIHMIWSFDEDLAVRFGKTEKRSVMAPREIVKNLRFLLRRKLPFLPRPPKCVICDVKETCIPNSEYVKEVLEGQYGVRIAPVFYPPTFYEPKFGVARNELSIGYVGRIHEEKGIHLIIETVEKVRESTGKDLRLYIAGYLDGSYYCNKLVKDNESRNWIRFVGEVKGERKREFLADKSIAMHCLKGEAFGISITEYIKGGVVPIVPRGSAPDEIVGDEELAYDSLAEAERIMSRLVVDRKFLESKRSSVMRRGEFFSKSKYLERQERLLTNILSNICDK